MRITAAILTLALLCLGAAGRAEEPGTRELAPGLYLVTGLAEAGNVAFLTTPEGVLVVDSGETEQQGRDILDLVHLRSPEPVRYLAFTHLHSDHTFGAPAFPVGTIVVGQRGLAAAMEKDLTRQLEAYPPHIEKIRAAVERKRAAGDSTLARTEEQLARNLAAFEAVKSVRLRLPQLEVDGTLDLRLGGQTVEVCSAVPSHTDDSSVARFPAQRAAHFGDLLFVGLHPYIGAWFGANTAHWIEVLEAAKGWDLAVVIPGHGPVGGRELLDAQIGYLQRLRREVGAAIASGATLEQATGRVGSAMRAAYPGYGFEECLPEGIASVWAELHGPAR